MGQGRTQKKGLTNVRPSGGNNFYNLMKKILLIIN